MRITRRDLIVMLAATPLAVACGQQPPAPAARATEPAASKPAATTAGTAQPAAQAAPAAKTAGPIKIRFWYGLGGQIGEVIVNQVKKFNSSQSNVEVEAVLQQSYDGVQEKFLASLVAGDVPELVQLEIHATPQFASSGALAPLEPFVARNPSFNFDDLVPATLLNQRWDGKLYAMPINRSTPLLYYNKNLFKQAGLDPEKPPKSWAELNTMGQAIVKSAGGDGKTVAFLPVSDWWMLESFVWSAGGELMSQDVKKVAFAEPATSVMQMWADMIYKDKTARMLTGETSGELRAQELIGGRCAFFVNSTAGLGRFIRDVKDFELGTAFMPYTEGHTNAVPTGGAAAAIPAKVAPEKQQAAFDFITWWISTEQGAFWSQNTGYFPIRKTSVDLLTQQGYYKERPQFKTTLDQLQFAREAPLTPHWPAICKEITKGMDEVLVNNTPAAQAMKKAQERAQALVEG